MGILKLRVADTFVKRLLGLHAGGPLADDEGLLLCPCAAVHSIFLSYPIDVVFLDALGRKCRVIHAMPAARVAWARGAHMAVELPAGYCKKHPDYLAHIHVALQLRVCPTLFK